MASTAIHLYSPSYLRLASTYDSVYNLVQKKLKCPHHQNDIKPNYSFVDSMIIEIREQKHQGLENRNKSHENIGP